MARRPLPAARLLLSLALAAPVLLALAPAARGSGSQTPDVTDTRYTSVLLAEHPVVAGLHWRVIDRNDEIEVINHSAAKVTVFAYSQEQRNVAYDGGPYAQILANGTVRVNRDSPAYYLNQSFVGTGSVPASASATAPPDWVTVAHNGTYIWHDHRIHYLSPEVPKVVTDVHRRTLVRTWYVPIEVGSSRGYLYGKLYWNAEKGFSFPVGAIIALIVVVLGGAALVVVVRRRRAGAPRGEAW
jgi:hypothetical protein